MQGRMFRAAALGSLLMLLCGFSMRTGAGATPSPTPQVAAGVLSDADAVGDGLRALLKSKQLSEIGGCFGLGVTVGAMLAGVAVPLAGIVAVGAAIRCFG